MATLAELAAELAPDLARRVFTHSSWASERTLSYERLEFLGDSVLGLCISTHIFERYPDYNEGELAKIRAYVVSRGTCARVAIKLGLPAQLAEAAREAGAANVASLAGNANVLAAVLEALIGALYLQIGLEPIMDAVIEEFDEHIAYATSEHIDYKTVLQEEVAKRGQEVEYRVVGSEGPPHARTFSSQVVLAGEVLGRGKGRTKKVSQQEAAKEALEVLREREEGA
ncbi:MAG: ribonuclease III [Thermoleophilia bacterium]|nr:ribonuclease III [Thermoleophilia bacterium]